MPTRTTPRVLLRSVGLAILGVLFAFILLETSIRIWKRHIAFQPDPQLIRSLRANVTRDIWSYDSPAVLASLQPASGLAYLGKDYTNNVGLRMKEDVVADAADERRILFLGDSFVEAEEVPDERRFYSLVQRSLDEEHHGSRRWRILNAGIQNGAPSQYVLQLRKYLKEFRPEIVVAFIAPNDGEDDFNFENRFGYEFDAHGIPQRPRRRGRLWLLQKCWTLRYVDVAAQKRLPWLYDELWPPLLQLQEHPDWWKMLCTDDPGNRAWFRAKTGRFLTELQRMSEAAGARFGVFLIHYMWIFDHEPFFEPAYPDLKHFIEERGCLRNKGAPYREFMHQFLEQNEIAYTDSYDAFMAAKMRRPREKLWNFYDYHFSPAGHRLVAREVLQFLEKRLLAPAVK